MRSLALTRVSTWAMVLLAGGALLTACAANRPVLDGLDAPKEAVSPLAPSTTSTTTTVPGAMVDIATVATATAPRVEVFDRPGAAEPRLVLDDPIPSGGPLVLLVDDVDEDWLEVLLPVRPNGSTGWIRARDVALSQHQYRIDVWLDEFELDVFDAGELVFTATVGVARDNAPTPGGRYYITELLQPPGDNSPYGSFAYGLSGFSEVFESFSGGPGQLGIHGTNDPNSIGQRVSAGCVRMNNTDIEELVTFLPLGTPVVIHA